MNLQRIETIKQLFAHAILMTRKWEVLVNRAYPKEELTLKQFMVLIVVGNAFDYDPSIKEVATVLATSHQNTKALCLQLEKKHFISLYKDPLDARAWRIKITSEMDDYWEERDKKDLKILLDLFRDISLSDLEITCKTIAQLDAIATSAITEDSEPS